MEITSPAFGLNELIPKRYTCDGENISPPLEFYNVPSDAESLVLIVEDPDAQTGTFTHWTLWNIRPHLNGIGEGNAPEGAVEGVTTAGRAGYTGPCPPSGTHRYFFRLFAITGMLDIPETTRPDILEDILKGRIVSYAEIMGTYAREG